MTVETVLAAAATHFAGFAWPEAVTVGSYPDDDPAPAELALPAIVLSEGLRFGRSTSVVERQIVEQWRLEIKILLTVWSRVLPDLQAAELKARGWARPLSEAIRSFPGTRAMQFAGNLNGGGPLIEPLFVGAVKHPDYGTQGQYFGLLAYAPMVETYC